MPSPTLPIFETISKAWIDAARAIRAMPLVVGCAIGIYALIAVGVFLVVEAISWNSGRSPSQWLASPAWFVFSVFDGCIQIILLAPLAIAIHRYVIRGEAARRYPLHPLRPSYLRYVGTALVLFAAYRVPDLISLLLPPRLPFVFNLWIFAVTALLMVTLAIAALQRITLFAAIAAYAPNATWRETEPVGAGHVLRAALILAGIIVPGFLAGTLLYVYLPTPQWPNGTGVLVLSLGLALVQLAMLCGIAAAVSRIYLAIGAPATAAQVSAADRPAIA